MVTSVNTEVKRISRREFLTYLWGASAALLAAEAGGAAIWYALPHSRSGADKRYFTFDPSVLPPVNGNPIGFPTGKFWLSNTNQGLLALSMLCVEPYRKGPIYFKWIDSTHCFACPVCASRFSLDGQHLRDDIPGPARRALDRFVIRVETPKGIVTTPLDGSPINIDGATKFVVDINKKILGKPDQ